MSWLFVMNIICGVNVIVWAGDVNDPSVTYCSINKFVLSNMTQILV